MLSWPTLLRADDAGFCIDVPNHHCLTVLKAQGSLCVRRYDPCARSAAADFNVPFILDMNSVRKVIGSGLKADLRIRPFGNIIEEGLQVPTRNRHIRAAILTLLAQNFERILHGLGIRHLRLTPSVVETDIFSANPRERRGEGPAIAPTHIG